MKPLAPEIDVDTGYEPEQSTDACRKIIKIFE
jgi:hypothetical protein